MNNNDLQADQNLLIHLREKLEEKDITGSDHVLNTLLEGILHHGLISYDIGDILRSYGGKCIVMKETVIDNWSINDPKSLLDALSMIDSFAYSQTIHLHICYPSNIDEKDLFSLVTQHLEESLGNKIKAFNVWQREDNKLCVRYFCHE